jgi:ABC-type bacteriocin/lantibiotic exporter with double-glycine peptidase domain
MELIKKMRRKEKLERLLKKGKKFINVFFTFIILIWGLMLVYWTITKLIPFVLNGAE